jgi:hypothetical protein
MKILIEIQIKWIKIFEKNHENVKKCLERRQNGDLALKSAHLSLKFQCHQLTA